MVSGNKLKDLIIMGRHIQWQYKIESYTDEALKSIIKSLNIARNELLNEIDAKDIILPKGRAGHVLDELNDLTFGIQTKLTGDIQEAAAIAGEASYKEYGQIMSFNGKLDNTIGFNHVALSAEQLRSIVVDTPVGGRLLNDWVTRTFAGALVEDIKTDILAGAFKGEGAKKLSQRISQGFDVIEHDAITLARTYIADANTSAAMAVYAANPDVIKEWIWSAVLEVSLGSGRGTCLRCAGLDGERYKLDEDHPPMPLHPRCRCFPLPVTKSYKELGLNIPEIRDMSRPFTARDGIPIDAGGTRQILDSGMIQGGFQKFLDTRGIMYKKDLLGPTRYELLKTGKITFDDLVDKKGNVVLLNALPGKKGSGGLKKKETMRTKSISGAQKAMAIIDISGAQKEAILNYSGGQYNMINGYLRGTRSKISESAGRTIKELDTFLKEAPRVETKSFRGISLNESAFKKWAELKKGDPFYEAGFMSTTYDTGVLKEFMGSAQYQVEMRIKGKNGVLIESLSDMPQEKEILFPSGSVFEVEKIKVKKTKFSGKITLDLTEK